MKTDDDAHFSQNLPLPFGAPNVQYFARLFINSSEIINFQVPPTLAMFWKHEKRILKAVIVGFTGSVVICAISDILLPFVGGAILGADMHMHVCVFEEPGLVIPFAIVGVIAGLFVTQSFEKSTQYSHSAHVFLSSAASILYLMGFGLTDWIHSIGAVFIIIIAAVMIPCCASDIVFPLACVHRNCDHPSELTHDH